MNAQTFVLVDQFKGKLTDYLKSTKTEGGEGTDIAIEVFVSSKLPEIVALAQAVMLDGKVSLSEVIIVIRFISELVRDSLNVYSEANITEKLGVVRIIFQFLASNLLPSSTILNYLLDDKALDVLINFVYKFLVKRRG